MLRIRDVMKMFGISHTTVYVWIKKGMPCVHVGKLIFFDEKNILEWVQSHADN